MSKVLHKLTIKPGASVRESIQRMDRGGCGILLVVSDTMMLLGIVTDGDIRRAILHGMELDNTAETVMNRDPLVAPPGLPGEELLRLMDEGKKRFIINHLPIVDEQGKVVDLVLRSDLVSSEQLPISAVIMAGGFGTRLRPLTEELPKPMLPVGGRPLMERIIEQLRQAGIRRVNVATHYRSEKIVEHFGDGRAFGVEIHYVTEDRPLGTAGGLGLMEVPNEPLLVINGDILTRVDFRAMLDFHREQHADMTVAVRQHEFRVPYGVVETNGVAITGVSEKPVVRHFINAGIYLLNPEVCRFIPNGQPYDMTDLISRLVAEGRRVVSFPVREYWLDIGQDKDYQKALADIENGEV